MVKYEEFHDSENKGFFCLETLRCAYADLCKYVRICANMGVCKYVHICANTGVIKYVRVCAHLKVICDANLAMCAYNGVNA